MENQGRQRINAEMENVAGREVKESVAEQVSEAVQNNYRGGKKIL